jgi:hypothetical protein
VPGSGSGSRANVPYLAVAATRVDVQDAAVAIVYGGVAAGAALLWHPGATRGVDNILRAVAEKSDSDPASEW